MRKFTKPEEALLEKIVSIHQSSSADSIPELQVAKLLRNELDFFAIKWETKSKPQITIYKPKSEKISNSEIDNIYFQIADFIYFLEELENAKFIKIQRIPTENQEEFTILYDREKYSYDSESDIFWQIMPGVNFLGNSYDIVKALVSLEGWKTFHTDFACDLDKYGMAIIYPLPLLIDFVENNYKTIEHRRFEEQLKEAKKSTCWSRVAAIGAIATLLLTLCQTYCSDKNDSEQINSVVSAIKEHKTVTIDSVKALPADTFNVNIIQPKVKPAPKLQQYPTKQPISQN